MRQLSSIDLSRARRDSRTARIRGCDRQVRSPRYPTHDARQVPRNAHVIVRNPHETSPGKRRLLIGRTDGGRALTLVIEQTVDPTTWLIVTGWDSSPRERKLLRN